MFVCLCLCYFVCLFVVLYKDVWKNSSMHENERGEEEEGEGGEIVDFINIQQIF